MIFSDIASKVTRPKTVAIGAFVADWLLLPLWTGLPSTDSTGKEGRPDSGDSVGKERLPPGRGDRVRVRRWENRLGWLILAHVALRRPRQAAREFLSLPGCRQVRKKGDSPGSKGGNMTQGCQVVFGALLIQSHGSKKSNGPKSVIFAKLFLSRLSRASQ